MTILHPTGLHCPQGHPLPSGQAPHDDKRAPLLKYKCRGCRKVFNVFTGTLWSGTHYDCATVVLILRGFAQGQSTQHLSRELGLDYGTLLQRRQAAYSLAFLNGSREALPDEEVESDEMFQNAGEKGTRHPNPEDPPRRRANKKPGKGTMDNDRPPVWGCIGRSSGQVRLDVCENTQRQTLQPQVESYTLDTATIYTDEASAYRKLSQETPRQHATVNHSHKEWARDEDQDGQREVHTNTIEGFWTGLRNFLRPFRGVHKRYLKIYVAMYQWTHNLKCITTELLRAMMVPNFTYFPT